LHSTPLLSKDIEYMEFCSYYWLP